MPVSRLAALALACAFSAPASAQWAGWDYEFDQEKKSWNEIQAQIPAYPKERSLIALNIGGELRHRYYIDADSISRGEDGVMRYTAVIRASGGATNVTFEGVRCETREHKLYALGRNDGTWVRARDPNWSHIAYSATAPHRGMLFRDYFCASRYSLPSAREVVDALKGGTPLNPAEQDRDS
jgi:hypothetical protein